MPKLFPRFSLLSFLLLAGLFCVTVSHIWVTQENRRQRAEIDKLKEDLGFIVVRDREKAYVRKLEMPDELTWRFRIYLPPKKKFMLKFRIGPSTSRTEFRQRQDQFTLTISFRKSVTGQWKFTAVYPDSAHSLSVSEQFVMKMVDPAVADAPIRREQQELAPDGEIELLRIRDDIRVWLESKNAPSE